MKPFAVPRSLAGSTLTASASIATSWVAPNMLWTNTIAVNSLSWVAKSTCMATSSVAIMPSCMARIQNRRRPRRSTVSVSTMGPAAHLKAHGR